MNKKIGIREKKKATLKLNILETTLAMLKDNTFERIKVTDVCSVVGISEVTFFKYFEKKEEILQYFMAVWNYKREMKLKKSGRDTGKAAIYKMFEDIASTENAERIMLSFIHYISSLSVEPPKIKLEEAEKWLLFPNEPFIEPMSLSEQTNLHLMEAIVNNELKHCNSTKELEVLSQLIGSIYYGGIIITHMTRQSLSKTYEQQLRILFKESSYENI